jgi:hypothetical protein
MQKTSEEPTAVHDRVAIDELVCLSLAKDAPALSPMLGLDPRIKLTLLCPICDSFKLSDSEVALALSSTANPSAEDNKDSTESKDDLAVEPMTKPVTKPAAKPLVNLPDSSTSDDLTLVSTTVNTAVNTTVDTTNTTNTTNQKDEQTVHVKVPCSCLVCRPVPTRKKISRQDKLNIRAVQHKIRPCYVTSSLALGEIKGCISVWREGLTFVLHKDNEPLALRLKDPKEITRLEMGEILGYTTPLEGSRGNAIFVSWIVDGTLLFDEYIKLEKMNLVMFVERANSFCSFFKKLSIDYLICSEKYACCGKFTAAKFHYEGSPAIAVLSDHFSNTHKHDKVFCKTCSIRYVPENMGLAGWLILQTYLQSGY